MGLGLGLGLWWPTKSSLITSLIASLRARSTYFENENCTKATLQDLDDVNLLEKASIVTTPTAYDNGSLNSIKPEQTFGNELVTNGDFATDSDWGLSSGSSIANGQLTIDALDGSFQSAQQLLSTTVGKIYKLQFEITSIISGGKIQFIHNNSVIGLLNYTSVGTHTFYFTSTNSSSFFLLSLTSDIFKFSVSRSLKMSMYFLISCSIILFYI